MSSHGMAEIFMTLVCNQLLFLKWNSWLNFSPMDHLKTLNVLLTGGFNSGLYVDLCVCIPSNCLRIYKNKHQK